MRYIRDQQNQYRQYKIQILEDQFEESAHICAKIQQVDNQDSTPAFFHRTEKLNDEKKLIKALMIND